MAWLWNLKKNDVNAQHYIHTATPGLKTWKLLVPMILCHKITNGEWMLLYVLVEDVKDIKNNINLFNNTHVFEPNISEKPFSVFSGWQLNCNWLIHFRNSPLAVSLNLMFLEVNHISLKIHDPSLLRAWGWPLMKIASRALRGISLSSLQRTLMLSKFGSWLVCW